VSINEISSSDNPKYEYSFSSVHAFVMGNIGTNEKRPRVMC
jgi:hypothetical protein